jgi:hypothetical protein
MEIVSCHFMEDLGWLEASPYPVHIVGKDGGDSSRYEGKFASIDVIPNFAKEAGSYLWYIVNNYEKLPERISFIHGHEFSRHQKVPIFEAMRLYENIPFVDLNRSTNFYCIVLNDSSYPYKKLWLTLLGPFLGPCPNVINFRGMAQFSVSRDLVLSRPKEFWVHLYDKTRSVCVDDKQSFIVACFYEAVWHFIFGMESPLDDKARPNLYESNGGIFIESTKIPEIGDYLDIFVDSNGKVYGPWGFINKLVETTHTY